MREVGPKVPDDLVSPNTSMGLCTWRPQGLVLSWAFAQEAKVADLKKEHRWRHWEGHWKQRRQTGGREQEQKQEAGAGARE